VQHGQGESVRHRRQERSISWLEAHFVGSELALQHADLVAQHENLDVLILITHRQQP
jgi:hypothetical protein